MKHRLTITLYRVIESQDQAEADARAARIADMFRADGWEVRLMRLDEKDRIPVVIRPPPQPDPETRA